MPVNFHFTKHKLVRNIITSQYLTEVRRQLQKFTEIGSILEAVIVVFKLQWRKCCLKDKMPIRN